LELAFRYGGVTDAVVAAGADALANHLARPRGGVRRLGLDLAFNPLLTAVGASHALRLLDTYGDTLEAYAFELQTTAVCKYHRGAPRPENRRRTCRSDCSPSVVHRPNGQPLTNTQNWAVGGDSLYLFVLVLFPLLENDIDGVCLRFLSPLPIPELRIVNREWYLN
jgi:hypothetical protein